MTLPPSRRGATGITLPTGITAGPAVISPGVVLDVAIDPRLNPAIEVHLDPRIPVVIGPVAIPDAEIFTELLAEAPPLLLLPLRLEYRVVDQVRPLTAAFVPDAIAARGKIMKAAARSGDGVKHAKAMTALRDKARKSFVEKPVHLQVDRELWLRWFPDSDFAQSGNPVVTAEEQAAVAAFRGTAAAQWWALPDAATSSAWQTLAQLTGPYRALHLLREGAGAGGAAAAIGRITALPKRVALFGLFGGLPELLATGAAIPANAGAGAGPVSYTPDALEPGAWLSEFSVALSTGMGVRITDPARIDRALAAEWIVAIGLSDADGVSEMQALISDGIANGTFGFLPQDAATNNTPGERSAARSFRDDPTGFLALATEAERGLHSGATPRAADLLAGALGMDSTLLRKAIAGGDTGFEDARAMLRVVAPGILDGAYDGTIWGETLDENDVIDVLAAAVVARGPLPNLRIGRNPYGVLPVTLSREVDLTREKGFTATEARVFSILTRTANLLRPHLVGRAKSNAARITPDAPEATPQAFEAILQSARASRRIELVDDATQEAKALGCAYVNGAKPENRPAAYLAALRTKRSADLPDPDATDRSWPLLYRLARVTMTRNISYVMTAHNDVGGPRRLEAFEALPAADRARLEGDFDRLAGEMGLTIGRGANRRAGQPLPARIKPDTAFLAQRLFRAYDAGLARLAEVAARPNGVAELETLLFEVFDVLQHRVDAWLTGVAYARLTKRRAAGGKGLNAGYFGMLGRLRAANPGAADDGYIQAPSLAQATTAAILRSAYRRHSKEGAFNLDLSSRRVRRGMALLDHLTAGSSLAAAMGLRAERLLRQPPQDKSHFIPGLRRAFPIANAKPPEAETDANAVPGRTGAPMLDGLALINAAPARFDVDLRPAMAVVRTILADDLDAVSDIIMAEAVHHRAMGAVEVANAWLSVLSGGTLPGRPTFLRTQRPGHAASHRVALLMPQVQLGDPAKTAPRALAEPGAAALALALIGPTGDLMLRAHAHLVADPAARIEMKLNLDTDLGLSPIDLLIGGQSEAEVRARTHVIEAWRSGPDLARTLGPFPDTSRWEDLIVLDLVGTDALTAAFARADQLRRSLTMGRALEPADFNAAAPAALGTLDAASETAQIAGAVKELDSRIAPLAKALELTVNDVSAALSSLTTAILRLQNQTDRDPKAPDVPLLRAQAEAARAGLMALAPRAASFAEPSLLRPISVSFMLKPGDDTLARLTAALKRLRAKQATLFGQGSTATTPTEARAALALRIATLRGVLDGEALPILPLYECTAATAPVLTPPEPLPAGLKPLAAWQGVRKNVAGLTASFDATPADYALYQVTRAASVTAQDVALDPRLDPEAPKSLHFGLFLSPDDPAQVGLMRGGVVVDEWVETRASTMQDAAMAVNYNTPDAQAPNAMLLCIPPSPSWASWTEERAARMVAETIELMQMRALTSDQRLARVAIATGGNAVPHKTVGATRVARIPEKALFFEVFDRDISMAGLFVTDLPVRAAASFGAQAVGLNIAGSFAFKED